MVVFDEPTHTYRNKDTNELYVSATQLLSKYTVPFDSEKHSARVALKKGITQEEVLKEWSNITKKSIYKGKNIHALLENYLKTGNTENGWSWLYNAFDYQVKELCNNKYDIIYSERLLWDDYYKIAGTSDIIVDIDDEFSVWDFKTNKKMSTFTPFKDYLLKPLDFLQNCSYNKYALQLSLYAYMYEKQSNKRVRNLCIFYLHEDRFIPYHVPYMKIEIFALLNHYKLNYINE